MTSKERIERVLLAIQEDTSMPATVKAMKQSNLRRIAIVAIKAVTETMPAPKAAVAKSASKAPIAQAQPIAAKPKARKAGKTPKVANHVAAAKTPAVGSGAARRSGTQTRPRPSPSN